MCDDDDEEQQDEIVEIEPGTCLRDVWAVVRQIGRGAYGQVYHVLNIKTGVQAALKGRVDDLWSWVYMCIELKDPLPWSQLAHPEAILGSKEDTSIEKICASEITKTFIPIAKLFQNLGYFDRPEYQKISEMLLQEIARLKVKLADPYEWEGKMSDPEATAKLTEVCNKYNLKFEDLPHTICDDATEESESKYIRDVFAPHPSDVPGGEQYEEKKRKSSERRNTDANASTPVTNA
ncbi:hypothetical protein Q1695_002484 [Nippostrongylus brasiliensis]|nr:hypothetical protein Q1695_002484 [Nippostrongylus brasiliensis]